MSAPRSPRITLTPPQIRQLQPFKDRVKATAALGNPGMLIAQLSWNESTGAWWMTPAFLPHEYAKLITEKGEHRDP